ncbi:MAG: magnesium/cobalt transporter CorA [Candidatus Aminicenantes bacterium]|nr:magnesium/cobalt transporter CorA [Candidatus Aminicenantes bacterium]
MNRLALSKRIVKVGLPPGSLVHVGEVKLARPEIFLARYNDSFFEEVKVTDLKEDLKLSQEFNTWVKVCGVNDSQVIATLGEIFNLHPLILEDIMNTDQRPKVEEMPDYLFLVLRSLDFDETTKEIVSEQIALILGRNFVLSFEESLSPVFEPVWERLRQGKGRLRRLGPDYLLYTLIDAIVDRYFLVLERLGERIENLEEELVANPQREFINEIHALKNATLMMRRSVWPLREAISWIGRSGSPLIKETITVFLRDVYDHTIQVIDTVETFRDMLSGMLDIYLSSLSHRMNEIMKVLTIIATIFIPITFIAGVYGMNFEYMPELKWPWGYFACLLLMLACALSLIFYFRKKKWL